MSVQTEITRLQGLKSRIRTKLVALGLAASTATLDDCTEALEGITDRGAATGSITAKAQAYAIAAGYHNGSGAVTIDTDEQAKIIPGNIKSGVTLLGVDGSYAGSGVTLQQKSVTPTESAQNITPDEGYDGLSAVAVGAIPSNYADVSGVTAGVGDVLANKIYVKSDGTQAAGTMVNNGAIAATIDGLTCMSYTITAGYHNGSGTVTLTGDIEAALAAL